MDKSLITTFRYDKLQAALKLGKWPLYFYGGTGRGKTRAAALIYAEWPKSIKPVCFLPAAKVIDDLVHARTYGGTSAIKNTFQAASLIVIDDIVDRNITDARRAALLDLLNWRANKPLILTGNFSPTELPDIVKDTRLVSRLLEGGTVLHFGGPDLRTVNLKIVEV